MWRRLLSINMLDGKKEEIRQTRFFSAVPSDKRGNGHKADPVK